MAFFHLISLGCAKNLVDSEVILGSMAAGGWQLTDDPDHAEFLILNTCGFIQPAVEEAIAEIFELIRLKEQSPEKKIVVVGCLVQRYQEQLVEDLPEVDLFVGTEGAADIAEYIDQMVQGSVSKKVVLPQRTLMSSSTTRIVSTPFFRAWLKITEGCNNRCSYCMIPSIRGPLRSRTVDDLTLEAQKLQELGVQELTLIAQDSTAYGNDLRKDHNIVSLLQQLLQKTSIPWLRLLYLYPAGIGDELLQLMVDNTRIVPYLDIPLQHVSDSVLYSMNRRYGSEQAYATVNKIRNMLPDIALRTTFLVGFPGETEDDFLELEKFLINTRIDHVGIFAYANEEGCPSENFANQVAEEVKQERREYLLGVQAELSADIQKKYLGRIEPVLIEGLSRETDLLLEGRTRYQAPDVDGCVYINDGVARPGEIVQVRITESQVYDLLGEIISPPSK